MSKTKIHARRKEQSAERKVKSVQRQLSHAQMEAQIASLEAKIALLEGETQTTDEAGRPGPGRRAAPNHVHGGTGQTPGQTHHANPFPHDDGQGLAALPFPREALPTPVLGVPTTMGDSVFLRWGEVPGANTIEVQLAYDAAFTKPSGFVAVDGSRTWATLTEMPPDVTFFLRLIAVGDGTNNSAHSNVRSIRTLPEGMAGTSDEAVTHLQHWLEQQQTLNEHFVALLPPPNGEVLSPAARRRLQGSGVRRYGYIDKVSDTAKSYPQFWPTPVHGEGVAVDFQGKLKDRLREIEVLRNLLIAFRSGSRVAEDMILMAGDEAFRMANLYYRSVREAARGNLSEAADVFEMLRLFWNKPRGTSASDEPTIPQVERDASALLHGTKDGNVSITHESPKLTGGVHEVIDNVRR